LLDRQNGKALLLCNISTSLLFLFYFLFIACNQRSHHVSSFQVGLLVQGAVVFLHSPGS